MAIVIDCRVEHAQLKNMIERFQAIFPMKAASSISVKIFRDLIYLMQGMRKADHHFYKAHGQYDFPQKHRGTMLKMYLVGALLSSPKLKEKAGGHINEGMIAP